MKLAIDSNQHSIETIINIVNETREFDVIRRASKIEDVNVAIAIAQKGDLVTTEILKALYEKYKDKDKVVKAICNNPNADIDLLHAIVTNRNKYSIWVYQDTLSHPNLSKEDLYTLFDEIVKYDMRIAYKFAMSEETDKELLIKILYLAYKKKDFDLLVTLIRNPKISKEDLL